METALLVNPARSVSNPRQPLALNPRRRRRRNPGIGGAVLPIVVGAGAYTIGTLVLNKMAGKKLGKWAPAVGIGLGVAGYWLLRRTRYARIGDAVLTLAIGNVASKVLGPMFEGKAEAKAKKGSKVKGLEAFNALLVERERQMQGIGDDGASEMDDDDELGDEGADEMDDDDELGADDDEDDDDELGDDDEDDDELGAELVMRE